MGNRSAQPLPEPPLSVVFVDTRDMWKYLEIEVDGDIISMNVTLRSCNWFLSVAQALPDGMRTLAEAIRQTQKEHLVVHDRVSSQNATSDVHVTVINAIFNDLLSALAALKDQPLKRVDLVAHIVETRDWDGNPYWYPISKMEHRRSLLGGIAGKNIVMAKQLDNHEWNTQLKERIGKENAKQNIQIQHDQSPDDPGETHVLRDHFAFRMLTEYREPIHATMHVTDKTYEWWMNLGEDTEQRKAAMQVLSNEIRTREWVKELVVHDRISSEHADSPPDTKHITALFDHLLGALAGLKGNPLQQVNLVAHMVEKRAADGNPLWAPIPAMANRRRQLNGIPGENFAMAADIPGRPEWDGALKLEIEKANQQSNIRIKHPPHLAAVPSSTGEEKYRLRT